jgi:signal transduction histidine kinase
MHVQQNVLDHGWLAPPTPGSSAMAATWSAVLEERHRLACEIHDTLAQAFVGILLHLESVPETPATGPQLGSDLAGRLAHAKHLAKSGLEDSRRMLLGLRPESLDGNSLVEALRALARRCAREWRIACRFRFNGEEAKLPPNVEDELYRISQEALCNVRKHSRATAVSFTLSFEANTISLIIKDNGQGFEAKCPQTTTGGFGLSSMRARALRVGADMDVFSSPRRGTEIRVRAPIRGIALRMKDLVEENPQP